MSRENFAIKLTLVGEEPRAVYINPSHIVALLPKGSGTTVVTTSETYELIETVEQIRQKDQHGIFKIFGN